MPLLVFRRFSEYATFDIDRANKKLKVNGEQTNYKEQELSWNKLWDKCANHKRKPYDDNSGCRRCLTVAKAQDKEMEVMKDAEFVQVFEKQMEVYGYKLVKWDS